MKFAFPIVLQTKTFLEFKELDESVNTHSFFLKAVQCKIFLKASGWMMAVRW